MSESSVHDIFEAEAADRFFPSPYMEKYFAKFEGLQMIVNIKCRSKSLRFYSKLVQYLCFYFQFIGLL